MKKLISAIMAVVFCLSLAVTAMIPAGAASTNPTNSLLADPTTAADGTLLYKVQFGYTYGVYQSHEIARDPANKGAVTVHDDEYGITFTLEETYDHAASPAKKWWYGDAVEGLALAEGNRYTIKYKIKNGENTTDDSRGTGFNGFFFNTNADGSDHSMSYGAYGNLTSVKPAGPCYDLFRSGKHVPGDYLSAGKYIYFNTETTRDVPVADDEGYVDCSVEVDGFKYYIYINGKFFDCTSIAEADRETSNQLGVIFYAYSSCGSLKDVEIYKGLTLTKVAEETTTENAGGTTKDPYAEDPPEPTTPAETTTETTAEEITPPKPDNTTVADTTTAAPAEKGCGGVALVAQVVAVLGCAVSFVVIRKKH